MGLEGPAWLWDAHVHLPSHHDPVAVLRMAEGLGVRLISVTVNHQEAAPNLAFRSQSPEALRCFIGIHPSEAESPGMRLEELSGLWESADGVGEVGLDPRYSEVSAKSAQMRLFESQVEVASRLGKPLEVHSRGAERLCLDVLDGYPVKSLLMHWFEGNELVERIVSRRRRFVSFGPAILYSKKLQRLARVVPRDAVLSESDGPVAFRALGGAGGPGLVPSVVFKLAEIWGTSFDEAVRQVSHNTASFLG